MFKIIYLFESDFNIVYVVLIVFNKKIFFWFILLFFPNLNIKYD